MNRLPVELICKIIKNLDLNDILNCRAVSKKWNSIINENIKINNLAIKQHDIKLNSGVCLLYPEALKNAYIFDTINEDFFQSSVIKTLLKNLKHLYVQLPTLYYNSDFDMAANLNYFVKLESLEFAQLDSSAFSDTVKLPNLKILSIDCYDGETLRLDVPKLEQLKCNCYLPKIELTSYDTVTHLFTELYEDCISKYKNLEYFHCEFLTNDADYDQNNLPKDILSILPQLKELHCSQLVKKDVIAGVLSSKNKLRRQNFKLFFNSLNIETKNHLESYRTCFKDEYEFLMDTEENFETLLDNFSRLSNFNQYIREINYTSLIKKFKNGINQEFFKKFVNIQTVTVNEPIENVDQLVGFLMQCEQLVSLEFNDASLDQSFYDNLPNHCPSLCHLRIQEAKIINLDFLLNFKKLSSFSINQRVTAEIIRKTFEQENNLKVFKFMIKKNRYLEVVSVLNMHRIKLTRDNKKITFIDRERFKFVNCFTKSTLFKCLDFIFEKC